MNKTIYDSTAKRLHSYKLFSPKTIEVVAKVAQRQAEYTKYTDFFKDTGVSKPRLHLASKKRGVPVVEIPAKAKAKGTIVIHLPMSNPLDENQLYHASTVATALLSYRVIIFGNPSGAPYHFKQQNAGLRQLLAIAFTRRRQALVSAEIDYLRANKVTGAHHIGYSYGAHKALIESGYLRDDEIASLTVIDPVAHPRGIKQLIHDFQSTFTPMGKYVDRTNIQSYFEARRAAAKTQHHKQALRRPISVAIGILMARFDFITNLKKQLGMHTALKTTVAWGSKSELGNDAHMNTSLQQLSHDNPGRVKALRLKDDEHALANDIHLYAAIVYEALRTS